MRSLEQELKVIRRNAEKFLREEKCLRLRRPSIPILTRVFLGLWPAEQDTVHATLLHIEICYVHLYGNAIALRALQERLKRRMKVCLSVL